MLVLKTSNFQGATIRTDSSETLILFCLYCSPLNFPVAACLKTENDNNLFIKISSPMERLGASYFLLYTPQMILPLCMY